METLIPLWRSHQLPVSRSKMGTGVGQKNAIKSLRGHNRSFLQFMFFLQVLEYLSRGLVTAGTASSCFGGGFQFWLQEHFSSPRCMRWQGTIWSHC